MNLLTLLVVIGVVALAGYLVAALLDPERFE